MAKILKYTLIVFFTAASLMLTTPAPYAQEELDKTRIEEIVRNYILEHPEIIAEAVQILQARAEAAAQEANRAAIIKNQALLVNDDLSITAGNPEGDVTLVEFYDYRCPYCRASHESISRLLAEDENLRIVFKQFPVKDQPGEVPVSLISARMAMAAQAQGLFLLFHDAMFSAEPPLSKARVYEIAARIGLDMEQLDQDMRDPDITLHLRQTLVLASEIGATGTPTFVIGEVLIPGMVDYDTLKEFITYTRELNAAQ